MRAPDFWRSRSPLSTLLTPLGALYAVGGRLRRALVSPRELAAPVVCIGNLVAGGAGKTPVALSIAQRLIGQGVKVHFLTQGYGGSLQGPVRVDPDRHGAAEVGDEPLLLARAAPCWVAKDRVAGAEAAIRDGADIIVMDDGHQNPALRKDLSIVVVDGGYGFGNGRVLPAGPLREPVAEGLARADAVALLGDDETDVLGRLQANMPILRGRLAPAPVPASVAGRPVLPFAGIGRPDKFFETVRAVGCEIVDSRAFPDHHPYSLAEIEAILAAAR
jgi:tetraacyldisaccharide 4'-kinase